MGTLTLRPNATQNIGTPNASAFHANISDASDSTNALGALLNWQGNGPFSGFTPRVSFPDATGTIPAGRQIMSVQFNSRVRDRGTANEAGAVGWRYTNHSQGGVQPFPRIVEQLGVASGTGGTLHTISDAFATAVWNEGTEGDFGDWQYADVDGIQAVLGSNDAGTSLGYGRIYDIWMVVTYTEIPLVPTSVTPANGSTITIPNPTLGGTLQLIPSTQEQKMEWQFATDTGFTTNVKTVTEAAADNRINGATTESPTIANLALTNGTWYMRGRAVDQYGIPGPYSSTNTLTVNVPILPTPTTITPANATTC